MYKERVQTRQLRTRPKTAIKSRDKQTTNPFCRPSRGPATIVLTIVGTPSRDFSAGTADEGSSSLFLRRHYHHRCRCPSLPRALSQPTLSGFASGFFVEIRLAFDLGGRERRTDMVVPVWSRRAAESSGSTGFSKGARVRAPRARITCQSYRDLKQLSSRPASLYPVTMLPPTIGRATFCHVAVNH